MKRVKLIQAFLIILLIGAIFNIQAQEKGNNLKKEERILDEFSRIKAGETFIITYIQSDEFKIVIETSASKLDQIESSIDGETLYLNNNSLRSPSVLNVSVYAPALREIDLSGVAEFYSADIVKAEEIDIFTRSASSANLPIKANNITVFTYGASKLKLLGSADYLDASVNGSSDLDAEELEVINASVKGKNKAKALVNVQEELKIKSIDESQIQYANAPQNVIKSTDTRRSSRERQSERGYYRSERGYRDRSSVRLGSFNFEVDTDRDSTVVILGRHKFVVDEYGNSRFYKIYRNRFNGHWGGVDLGINAYVTPGLSMDLPEEAEFLDLKLGKSIRVDLNIFEQNIPLSRNNRWGLITGIGFELRNYRFDRNIYLDPDQDVIKGYYIERGVNLKKHKMTANYLSIPFIFEFQTNAYNRRDSFHASLGCVFGLRIGSKTKMVFDEKNLTYNIYEDEDRTVWAGTITTPDTKKVKNHDSYHLNPIKTDVMFRFGWGWLNFYASYSLNTLFKKSEGPKLHPISFGITLVKW